MCIRDREWDKTFPKSDKVEHSKVVFVNRFGVTLAADMYELMSRTLTGAWIETDQLMIAVLFVRSHPHGCVD